MILKNTLFSHRITLFGNSFVQFSDVVHLSLPVQSVHYELVSLCVQTQAWPDSEPETAAQHTELHLTPASPSS